jgi:hypothetical protein
MIDLPWERIDESPRLRKLINNLIRAASLAYRDENSLQGAALRDLIGACKSPTDEIWKELKVKPNERMQFNNVASAAHQTLKGTS